MNINLDVVMENGFSQKHQVSKLVHPVHLNAHSILCVQRNYFSTLQLTLKVIFYSILTMLTICDPTLFARMLNLSVVIFHLFINFRTLCYRILAHMKYPIPNSGHYYPKRTHDPYEKSARCIRNYPKTAIPTYT